MVFIKEFNDFIDRRNIKAEEKQAIKNYTLQLLNTEKLIPKTNLEEFSNYILDMFLHKDISEEQRKGYLQYIINCIYKEGQKEKKC